MKNRKQHSGVRKQFMLALFLAFFASGAYAQTRQVAGKVLDSNGEPLVGATIRVVGKPNMATTTDANGEFKINAPESCIISASYIGMQTNTARVKAGENKALTISLLDDGKTLDDVVVTALGISREAKSLGYARQSVNTEGLDDIRDPNLLNSLTGKVSGVNFISNGGPLSSTRVEIRGNNSITGYNQPLYVVDGVPILNDMGDSGDMDYGNAASFVSPDDIESIEVLKGANASALYGSEAANGVILITTRQAKKKKGLGISYDYNMQFTYLRDYPQYQNIYGTMAALARPGNNGGYNVYGFNAANGYSYNPELPYGIYVYNWANKNQRSWGLPMLGFTVVGRDNELRRYSPADESITDMYQTGIQITNNVSIDKVFNGGSYRISYTGLKYDGMLKNMDDMWRHNFTLNANADLAKWLSVNASVNYQLENTDNRAFKGASNRNPLYAIAWMSRDVTMDELLPYKKDNGEPMATGNGFYNPYWLINECQNGDDRHNFRGVFTVFIKPIKGLTFRLRGSMEKQDKKGWTFTNMYTQFDTNGKYDAFTETASNYNYEGVAIYDKRWKIGLSLNATAGVSYLKQQWNKTSNTVNELAAPDIKSLSNNASILTGFQQYSGKEKEGIFGAASLGYKGVYLDGTFRNDWSSTLPEHNNSYFYYSGSVSAVLTDMFPKLQSKVLSFLKLRGSYAKVGNDTGFDRLIDSYNYGGLFRNNMAWYQGDRTRKNPDLKPETTTSAEVGLELRLLRDRFNLDVTYYDKRTKDQIIQSAISYLSGYQNVMMNSGEVSNKGWEISIKAVPVRYHNFQWQTIINWSKNNNMVESLPNGIDRIQLGGAFKANSYAEVGKPYGALYGQAYLKNDKGQYLCNDNGGLKPAPDQEYLGCVQAKWRGGWQNTFRWGNFSASVMIDFQHGGMFLSNSARQGATDGQTVQSLQGRDDYFFFSRFILGESDRERQGYLDAAYRITPGNYTEVYQDWQHSKGVPIPNCVYDDDCDPEHAGKPVVAWMTPESYWMNNGNSVTDFIYSASYIKLREITISYDCPRKWFRKTPIQGLRLSAVGRNLATLYSNTPHGLDPQATSTTGNAQGFENGFTLPEATMGFDIKVTF